MENSKNIFILPTTEPSQVYLVKSKNTLGFTSGNLEFMEHYGSGTHNQHIYITNKDLYDRGDWLKNVTIEAEPPFKFDSQGIIRITQNVPVGYEYEKIILTSDQKLVADGIAEIDFEFLKLLKDKKLDNISNVTVEKTPLLSNNGRALFGYKYTPIIPPTEPQQETLEQVAERILANNIDGLRDALKDDDLFFFYKGVIQCYGEAMAEWQQQNSYSEADMKESFDAGYKKGFSGYPNTENWKELPFNEWLEKFKFKNITLKTINKNG
jgi:hypothetical protein